MFNTLRVLQIGCGKMSKYTMRYVFEKGGAVVAGIDTNPALIGQDIGLIMGTAAKGAIVYAANKLQEVITSSKPDIAIIETMSLLKDIADSARICLTNGISVITTCEEAFSPLSSNPNLCKELNDLAIAHKCTITGCGYQDTFWGNLVTAITGSTHKITKIKGMSSYNVEDYGLALAKAHGAGLSVEQFNNTIALNDNISDEERKKLIEEGNFLPSYMWNTVWWLADKLNLNIKSIEQKCLPKVTNEPIHSETLKMDIPVGAVTGMSGLVTALTEEGIIIEAECVGKVYSPVEYDANIWMIEGEPSTTVTINRPNTVELTCANLVNRIPDVLNSRPGFVLTTEMGEPKYRVKNLKEYLKKK